MKSYLQNTSHRFYGAAVALVMMLLYECLIIWGELPSGGMIRNAPEAVVRSVLVQMGVSHYHVSFILITVALIALPLFYQKGLLFKKRYICFMVVESIIWGLVSGVLIQGILRNLPLYTGTMTGSLLSDIGLSIGAGLYEELMFRVLLTTFLMWLFSRTLKNKVVAVILSVLVASFLFSLSHYIGGAADAFRIYSFTFRFLAGLWFTALYAGRGFAVVCMTHAFYDIFVVTERFMGSF